MDNRIARINVEIQKVINETLQFKVKDPRISKGGLVSVSKVDTSRDFSIAKVYVSIFDYKNSKEVLEGLNSSTGFIKTEIASNLDLRKTPDIKFIQDKGAKNSKKINDLLNKINS